MNTKKLYKIIQKKPVLDFLNENDYIKKENKEYLKEKLKNAIFKDSCSGKNYKITDIDFDKNPKNKSFTYNGKSITIFNCSVNPTLRNK